MQLTSKVALHDVLDVEAFVRSTIAKGRLRLTVDEREELVGEGMLIMVRLAKAYEPGRNGLDPAQSKFSGYAAKFLPGKLSDANHRLQESHRLVTLETGERRWQYDTPPASLDAVVESTGTDHIRELRSDDVYDSDMARNLRGLLEQRWERDRETTVKIGVLLGLGYAIGDAAKALRLSGREATMCVERIKDVAHEIQAVAA